VLKWQKISSQIILLHMTASSLSQIVLTFDLHRSTLPHQILPQKPTPCWFERRRHSMANAAEWLEIAQSSQWRAYKKPPSLFRIVPSLTAYDLPFSKMGTQMQPPSPVSNVAFCQFQITLVLVQPCESLTCFLFVYMSRCQLTSFNNKKASLSQGNRAMLQLFYVQSLPTSLA